MINRSIFKRFFLELFSSGQEKSDFFSSAKEKNTRYKSVAYGVFFLSPFCGKGTFFQARKIFPRAKEKNSLAKSLILKGKAGAQLKRISGRKIFPLVGIPFFSYPL